MKNTHILVHATILTCLAFPAVARAESSPDDYPLVFGQRPLTLTNLLSELRASVSAFVPSDSLAEESFGFSASYSLGLFEDLTIGARFLPLNLSPDFEYGNPRIYGTYRFIDVDDFDVGLNVQVKIPTDGTPTAAAIAVLGRIFLNNAARLDVGISLAGFFGEDGVSLSFEVPIELAVSLTRQLYVIAETGFLAVDLGSEDYSIGLLAGLGYSFESDSGGPVADVFVKAGLPYFIATERDGSDFSAELGASIFF